MYSIQSENESKNGQRQAKYIENDFQTQFHIHTTAERRGTAMRRGGNPNRVSQVARATAERDAFNDNSQQPRPAYVPNT